MILSDTSITRPVFASVLSLLLVVFGLVSFNRLPLREYPDIDPPVVSVTTRYPGASANVVETRITQVIEDRVAGLEGIRSISSQSEDGQSSITIEFDIGRDIDGAANDIRDRVSGVLRSLPDEADPPEIQKIDSNADVIMWLNLESDRMSVPQLTDYAERYLVDRFSVLDGVARVRLGGGQTTAMRVWLDREAMAARGLTVADIEAALRSENLELPAGSIESIQRQFTIRVNRVFHTAEDFTRLVIARGENGYLVRLGDVAEVRHETVENRTFFRGNGIPMVGLGITKQSTANTVEVARKAREEAKRLNTVLPEGMQIKESFDTSIFISQAIHEVYWTLFIALILVVLVIYLFLGTFRATLIPAVTVPVSIVSTFTVLLILGFSVNLITLLALVLAIGLVVDDAIVVLENIHRRMEEKKETALVAAFYGTRQVGFAVIATTLVLISVFTPIAFLQGDVGRLFSEFALTMIAAVSFSSLVALTLSPMLASKILKRASDKNFLARSLDAAFNSFRRFYCRLLKIVLRYPWMMVSVFGVLMVVTVILFRVIPSEYAPREDRGTFFLLVNGPEGATYSYMKEYMDEIERRMQPLIDNGEVARLLVRAPRAFGNIENFNSGIAIFVLSDWASRRPGEEVMNDVRSRVADLSGVRAFPVMRQGFGSAIQKPVQFVIGGGTYEELAQWRDILVSKINENNPGLVGVDWDYKETKPQIQIDIDYNRAAELGVKIVEIGRTLETMLGSRQVTTFIEDGEEYDVILQGQRERQRTPTNLENIYMRSSRGDQLIPLSSLVRLREQAGSSRLNRYNRIRSITIEANLDEKLSLGEALSFLETLAQDHLPETAIIDYKGQSRDFRASGQSMLFVFLMGLVVVFLVLAGQFESYVHPFVIMLTVPLAVAGGLLGLWLSGSSLNIYSQIGLIMLVGLAAKNGILIVEFANQLRDEGSGFVRAIFKASLVRLRPIIMTGLTTAVGAVPLILSSGAGAETRMVIGVVVLTGVLSATVFTLLIVPVAYLLFSRRTGSPGDVRRQLEIDLSRMSDRTYQI